MKQENRPDIYWDSIADMYQSRTRISSSDFHYGPLIAGESLLKLLPEDLAGMSALELGCGAARNSIWLASQGARCTAMDCSSAQLKHARTAVREAGVDVELMRMNYSDWCPATDQRFDLIHSSNALQFADSPGQLLSRIADGLAPDGLLVVSVPHPLFAGEWLELGDEGFGLFIPSYFTPQADTREDDDGHRVVSRTYPISAWVKWLGEANLQLDTLLEPAAASGAAPYSSSDWEALREQLSEIPSTLIFTAQHR